MSEAFSPERVARNEAAFREANERIEAAADEIGDLEEIPFVCECAGTTCTEIVRFRRAEYERIRGDGATFWVVPGHEATHVDGTEVARILQRDPEFTVLEKIGKAGETARQLDPRGSVSPGGA